MNYAISNISNDRIITYVNVITRILRILVITFTQLSLRDARWTRGDIRMREAESMTVIHDGIKRQKQKQWIGQHWQNNTRADYYARTNTTRIKLRVRVRNHIHWPDQKAEDMQNPFIMRFWKVRGQKNWRFGGMKKYQNLDILKNMNGQYSWWRKSRDWTIVSVWKMMCNNNGWRGIRNMERTERRTVERPIVFATRVLSNTRHKHK